VLSARISTVSRQASERLQSVAVADLPLATRQGLAGLGRARQGYLHRGSLALSATSPALHPASGGDTTVAGGSGSGGGGARPLPTGQHRSSARALPAAPRRSRPLTLLP
jgi:hypothetical protein